MLLCSVVLYILLISSVRGIASKALLMSIVISNVRCGGLLELIPSFIFCVRFVSSVVVE